MSNLKKNDIVYYARAIPLSGIYDVLELKIRTVETGWCVGIEKRDKQAFLFSDSEIGKTIFTDRREAVKKIEYMELRRKETINTETYYEEY